MDIPNAQAGLDWGPAVESSAAQREERRLVQRPFETMLLFDLTICADALRHDGPVEDLGEIQVAGLPMRERRLHIEAFGMSNHLIQRAETQASHQLAHFLSDEPHECDDMVRITRKSRAQRRILGGDADRARVQMTYAHHHATHGNERRGSESEFFRTEERSDYDVAPGL